MSTAAPGSSDYHLARPAGARLAGAALVVLAGVLAVATVVVVLADWSLTVLLVVAVVGLVVAFGPQLRMWRTPVVHLDAEGYRIRLLRQVGVTRAAWTEVEEAVTTTVGHVPVVVLRLVDGRSTTIPVTVLAADREEFARDLQAHLRHGQGLRPLA